MKKTFILLVALVAMTLPHAAQAVYWEGFYVGGFGAANFIQNTRKHHHNRTRTGYAAGGAVGYRWCNGWRAEFEVGYRNNSLKRHRYAIDGRRHGSRQFHTWDYMANVYYDVPLCWMATPYVGAGIGYANSRFNHRRGGRDYHHSHSNKRRGFAWQVIAGVSYPIWECTDIAVEYRLFKGRVKDIYNHSIGARLNYYF